MEESGIYHACALCLYQLREYKNMLSMLSGDKPNETHKTNATYETNKTNEFNKENFGLPVVMLKSLGKYNAQPHILIKPTKLTAKYMTSSPQVGAKRKLLPAQNKDTPKSKKIKLDKKTSPIKSLISPSIFGKRSNRASLGKQSPLNKTSTPKQNEAKSAVRKSLSRAAAANKSLNETVEEEEITSPKKRKSNGKKVSFNNVLDVSYVSENGEIEREEKEEMSLDGSSRRLQKDASIISSDSEINDEDDDTQENEEDDNAEIICDDEPDEMLKTAAKSKNSRNVKNSSNDSEAILHSLTDNQVNSVSDDKKTVDADSSKDDTNNIDSVTSTTPENDVNESIINSISDLENEKSNGTTNDIQVNNSSSNDEETTNVVDLLNDLISTTDKDLVNTLDLSSVST